MIKDTSILFTQDDLDAIKNGKTEYDKDMAALLESDLTGFLLDQGQYYKAQKEKKDENKQKLKKTEKVKKVVK